MPSTTPGLTRQQIQEALQAEQWIYIAVGPNCWGKGFTQDQALAAAVSNNREARTKHLMYAVVDPWAVIDDMGGICYTPRMDDRQDPNSLRPAEYVEVYRKEATTRRK